MQFWEHTGNAAMRDGNWKLVRFRDEPWELYDLAADPTEGNDLAAQRPELVEKYASLWQDWADRVGVRVWGRTWPLLRPSRRAGRDTTPVRSRRHS